MKKNFFYSLFIVILSFGLLAGPAVLHVSVACAQAEDGFEFEFDEDEESEDAESGFDFDSDDEDSLNVGSGEEEDEEDGFLDAPESSGAESAFGDDAETGEETAASPNSEEEEVSKPRENPVAFPSNGTQAGETAELTLHGVLYRFRWCPAGTFQMGSPLTEEGRGLDEKQMETVIPHGFWILE